MPGRSFVKDASLHRLGDGHNETGTELTVVVCIRALQPIMFLDGFRHRPVANSEGNPESCFNPGAWISMLIACQGFVIAVLVLLTRFVSTHFQMSGLVWCSGRCFVFGSESRLTFGCRISSYAQVSDHVYNIVHAWCSMRNI